MIFKLRSRWTLPVAMVALIISMASGCKTTGAKDEGKGLVPAPRIVFQPSVRKVPVQAGEGSYPNLFTGATYAVWGSNESMAAMMPDEKTSPVMVDDATMVKAPSPVNPQTMEESMPTLEEGEPGMGASSPESGEKMGQPVMMARNGGGPVVVTCYLESQFSDMSVAYDVVGLRGIQLHLELPDGSVVLPVQKELDSDLVEVPVGALRRFGRKITLYFPSKTIMVDNPAVTPGSRGVRLVLEGHNSQFYFEWPALPETTATVKGPPWHEGGLRMTKATYRSVSSRAKTISHEFD